MLNEAGESSTSSGNARVACIGKTTLAPRYCPFDGEILTEGPCYNGEVFYCKCGCHFRRHLINGELQLWVTT